MVVRLSLIFLCSGFKSHFTLAHLFFLANFNMLFGRIILGRWWDLNLGQTYENSCKRATIPPWFRFFLRFIEYYLTIAFLKLGVMLMFLRYPRVTFYNKANLVSACDWQIYQLVWKSHYYRCQRYLNHGTPLEKGEVSVRLTTLSLQVRTRLFWKWKKFPSYLDSADS